MFNLGQIVGFQWDEGNVFKSAEKHGVTQAEAENVLANEPLIVSIDGRHSDAELRFNALGRISQNRLLHLTFTLRQHDSLIRIISARDMHRKERAVYEQA